MRTSNWRPWAGALILAAGGLQGRAVAQETAEGGLLGFVQDPNGAPLAGAVISLFGRGLGGRGMVTQSDSGGRYFVRSLPAGSYTVRALRDGHQPARARKVTVLPDRDAILTTTLTPLAAAAAAAAHTAAAKFEEDAPATRELVWLLRHKTRSVLESRDSGAGPPLASLGNAPNAQTLLPSLDGSVELLATPAFVGVDTNALGLEAHPGSFSVVRLNGRLGTGRWSLGGLVAESEGTTWRMVADFMLEPVDGHEVEVGTGYGTHLFRSAVPLDEQGRLGTRTVGAVSVRDRWQVTDELAATFGGRFSYIGFLRQANPIDPSLELEFTPDQDSRVIASFASTTVVPGGDLLALSTLSAAPALAFARLGENLQPERGTRVELGVHETVGRSWFSAHTFYEAVRDQLANSFEGGRSPHSLRIFNAGRVSARGLGVTLGRRFADGLSGSVSYTYGHSWRATPLRSTEARPVPRSLAFRDAGFHDVEARLEAAIDDSDTRLVAFYRFNSLLPGAESGDLSPLTSTRFDVQLSQGLPFLGTLTRADWDFLLAVRNLYYEPGEGATLDELAVLNPPRRLLGGISVRF
ncbi:MAG TPA: TonB-dependent receptor [Vicinamibacteria bacterium]|nr:TonB-dependent receptor [Vicinamibacteria bacterium]